MKKPLNIILITVLLDIIWLWIVVPILPFIIQWYGYSEFYVWLTLSIFSLWMFFWGLFFWKLSDKIWRNRTLEITIWLNVIWYILFALSSNLWIFIIARFIWWLWASWMSVWQAYISDISTDENRIQNMWLIWAMFWIWFMIWPVVWWVLSSFWNSLNIVWFFSAFIWFLNLLLVYFVLPKVKMRKVWIIKEIKFHVTNKNILILFLVSFITALWFSAMQSTFPLVMNERFLVDSKHIWYLFWFIWLIWIIYQWLLIKYVKKYLKAYQMIIFGLWVLILWFILFAINNIYYLVFFIIFMFPVWYWTINPSTAWMLSKLWADHAWKVLWINTSMVSLWNIVWPFLAWSLYLVWSWLPYIISSIFFVIAMCIIIFNRKRFI
jgi:DHA1 family tetracycline resistance protein-like MFS transporter